MLLIPLRLGLADVNAAYAGTLKVGLCRPLPSAPGSCRILPTAARPACGWADPGVHLRGAPLSPSPRLGLPRRTCRLRVGSPAL